MTNQLKYFDEELKKKHTQTKLRLIFETFKHFFFKMSSDRPALKVLVFTSDLEFGIEVNEYYKEIFQLKPCSPQWDPLITLQGPY